MEWIISQDTAMLCPQDENLIQRYVLAVFFFSTRGERWRQCSAPSDFDDQVAIDIANAACTIQVTGGDSDAWLTPGEECNWGGLGCNVDNNVVRIEMGTIQQKRPFGCCLSFSYYLVLLIFCALLLLLLPTTTLLYYSTEQNGIAGTLPFELNRLQSLRYLLLEEGILTGSIPSELGDIRTLEQIDLNFNLLAGSIPDTIYTLTNLQQMDLNDNELTGTISPLIGQLSRLTFFQIDKNLISGTVPTEMGRLQMLGKNNIVGGLFAGGCHHYYLLRMFLFLIHGCRTVYIYCRLLVLTEVATLDNNQMSGTMPAQVCSNSTGSLEVLTADCLGAPNRPSPPLVLCDCCTECF
jgi:hypothetical protein